jgi:hypothetical protein
MALNPLSLAANVDSWIFGGQAAPRTPEIPRLSE